MCVQRQLTSDLDIYRSAKLLVKQHGKEAPIHAALATPWLPAGHGVTVRRTCHGLASTRSTEKKRRFGYVAVLTHLLEG